MTHHVSFTFHAMAATFAIMLAITLAPASTSAAPLKVLLIDGQNNHAWAQTSPLMTRQLTDENQFTVEVSTSPPKGSAEADWNQWQPDFAAHDVVVLNYNGELWPRTVQQSFVQYVRDGGGVVVIHAANNAFRGWTEYEEMVAMLWRPADWGERIITEDNNRLVRVPKGQGPGAGHGQRHPYTVTVIDPNHSITLDLPTHWTQCRDELYHGQRGPARDVHLLMVAHSDKATGGTGENEPMLWWVPYGKGRVVTNVMGHDTEAIDCVGFATLLRRSCEWAATGQVTTPIPQDFPAVNPPQEANADEPQGHQIADQSGQR